MKVCIFGAGGIGSYLGAKIAAAGECEVSAIGRGKHLDAIQRDGLRLVSDERVEHTRAINAVAHASELPPQDIVLATVKATSLPSIADELAGLLAPGGVVVFANNGIPWWWNHGLTEADGPLPRVDPEGVLWSRLGPERALGCVLYSANSVTTPGTVTHIGNNRWLLAEPTNIQSERLLRTVALLRGAGINAEISTDLREEIWKKLLRNAPFNSLCALTRLSAAQFCEVPALIRLAQAVMDEVRHVAAAQGWNLPEVKAVEIVDAGGLINGRKPAAKAYPSMLQDALLGRAMEVDAILGQIQSFAQEESVSTPYLNVILAILTGLDQSFVTTQVRPDCAPAELTAS